MIASNGTDYVDCGTGNDILRGDKGTILGGAGDDAITGGRGNDTIDGGGYRDLGMGDIAGFSGTSSQHALIGDSTGLTVTDFIANGDDTNVLVNLETPHFSDGDVPLGTGLADVSIDGVELG